MLCKFINGPQFQFQFQVDMLLLAWRKASENFYCYSSVQYNGQNIFIYLTFLMVAPEAKCVP